MADKRLNIKVRTDGAKRAKKDLKGVEGGMKSLGKAAAMAGSAFFAARGLINGFKKVIELAAAQELAEKKLEAALGKTSQALLNQASALQQVSMFGDEQIIEAQALIAAFVDEEEAIAKATQATLDLAAAKGMDLTAAADLISKTLGSSTNAMSRYGIEVNGAVGSTERLDSLVGNIADKFGGQAKAQTETMAGAIRQLEMAVGDAGEKFGNAFNPAVTTATTVLAEFVKTAGATDWDLTFGSLRIQLAAVSPHFAALANGLDAAAKKIEEAKQKADEPTESPFPTPEEMIQLMEIEAQTLQIRRKEIELLKPQPAIYKEINSNAKMIQEWTATTASSLAASALMGDNVVEALKRAVLQMIIMVAQAKLYDHFMTSATAGTNKVFAAVGNFLFGASPTQTAPSAHSAASSITTTVNITGGVIDQDIATNQIIPAINKAISTGQARIG